MSKKSQYRQPQKRRVSKESIEPGIQSLDVQDVSIETTLDTLADMFEVEKVILGESPDTYLGSILSGITNALSQLGDIRLDNEEAIALIPELVAVARSAAIKLSDKGFNRITNFNAISTTDFRILMTEFAKEYLKEKGLSRESVDFTTGEVRLDDQQGLQLAQQDAYNPQYNAISTLATIYGMTKGSARQMQGYSIQVGALQTLRETALGNIERSLRSNPSTLRRETTKTLRFIFSNDVTQMLEHFGYDERANSSDNLNIIDTPPVQELDFTVLPKGTDIYEYAASIVGRINEHDRARIDLDRLNVLMNIRAHVGEDRCYFAHGKKSGKQMIHPESETAVDEDYIALIMQSLNANGETIGEHALAISPIANKHAAYLVRQDAVAGSWRELLSLPKQDARYFGARDLRFTGSSGHTPYLMMEEKIKALLQCPADDFHEKLRMRSDGSYRLENNSREVGKAASKHLFGF